MAKAFFSSLLIGLLATGCASKKDSTEVAQDANAQRIEATKSDAPDTKTADSESNQKDVADYLVALANAHLTTYALSKLAAQRATTPAINAYARQTVARYLEEEQALRLQAQQYNVTLPTTLSENSQLLLTKLQEEKAGSDFDRTYLANMAELNDGAIGKAKNLIKNTNKQALISFVENLTATHRQRMEEATNLKDAIR